MPLLAPQLPEQFVISVFGVQYHGLEADAAKTDTIQTLEILLEQGATFVEKMVHDDSERGLGKSRIFVSYWMSPQQFQTWWTSQETAAFWNALPVDDAGVYRETMVLYKTRFVTEQSQNEPAGSGHLGPLMPLTEKTGYWGALRDRIDESTTTEKLLSSLPQVPPMPTGFEQKAKEIHRGRVVMREFPRNLCFVLEGQDRGGFNGESDEGRLWSSKFHYNTSRFITNVLRSGAEGGLLSARLCHAPDSGLTEVNPDVIPEAEKADIFPALNFNRTAELFFFLDFHYMERAGRREKSHVALRREFMEHYGPGCPMNHGKMFVWVDCGIVKPGDLVAEYVGCYEGTGFLPYREHPAFQSVPTSTISRAWSAIRSYVPVAN